ncbi:MAG: hypothetical protein ABI663_11730 [Chryseolinea sp.]
MKKVILIIFSFVLLSGLASAQVYFRAGGGYALPTATESVGDMQTRTDSYDGNNYSGTNKTKNVSASYGSGINFNAGAGFMFSEFFGVDLNISYLAGKKYKTGDRYNNYVNGVIVGTDETITTTNSKAIFITPSFVITTGGAHAPYGRFGVVLGSPKVTSEESSYYDTDGTGSSFKKWESTGGLSAGFQGAVGMNWTLGSNLKLYTEVNFTSMTFYPKEANLTESTNDGVSDLDQTYMYYKKTEFVKSIDNTAQIDYEKPRQELRQGTPFSSVAIQVGVVYSIGGKNM